MNNDSNSNKEELKRKSHDIFMGRFICSLFAMLFVVLGGLTIYGHYHYDRPVDLTSVNIQLSQIIVYMGLLQITLGLLPLTIYFESKKGKMYWALSLIGFAITFLALIYTNILFF